MKKIIFASLILSCVVAGCGSDSNKQNATNQQPMLERTTRNEVEKAIYASADSMMLAFKKQDWNTFAAFTHPAMVQVMGGTENLAQLAKQQMTGLADTVVKRAEVDSILQVVTVDNELQCLVKQTMVFEQDGNRITSTSYLVGESLNEGKSWTFFDASNEGKIKPIDIKPNLSTQFNIPRKQQQTTQL